MVGGTILTPILLKLVFRNDGQADSPAEGGLVDRYDKMEQLDYVSEQLLQRDQDYLRKGGQEQQP